MPRESAAAREARTLKLLAALKKQYPDAGCSLEHVEPIQLLEHCA